MNDGAKRICEVFDGSNQKLYSVKVIVLRIVNLLKLALMNLD